MTEEDYITDLEALEALVVGNPDLEHLEAHLQQFNIFEAIGAVRQELRHSDFLAFLLNPVQPHGLGDAFVKGLLQKVIIDSGFECLVSAIDLDIWSLDELEIRREWNNIDILLIDTEHNFVVTIENKIDGSEHSSQLQRYKQIIHQHFPVFEMIFLYLTPEGKQPTDEAYIPVAYTTIYELLDTIVESRTSILGLDVQTVIRHYIDMLRRHVVNESEIAELCRRIYRRHQRAIDLIIDHRPDLQSNIHDLLVDLIDNEPGWFIDHDSKSYVVFGLKEWDTPALMTGQEWSPENRILLFQFENFQNSLALKLYIGPGSDDTRQKLYQIAQDNPPLKAYRVLGKKWNTIFKRSFLTKKSYEEASIDDLEEDIKQKWQKFIENDLPAIKKIVKAQDWIWENG